MEKNIASFILSAPWIGGASIAKTECGGDNLGEPIPHDYLMPVQREAEWCIHHTRWIRVGLGPHGDDPIEELHSGRFACHVSGLESHTNFSTLQSFERRETLGIAINPRLSNVMYSTGKDRRVFTDSAKNNDLKVKTTINGDGDGTVNIESLVWAEKAGQKSDVTFS